MYHGCARSRDKVDRGNVERGGNRDAPRIDGDPLLRLVGKLIASRLPSHVRVSVAGQTDRLPVSIQDGSAHRCNRCTSPARWIRHGTHIRYRVHNLPLLRRAQALSNLQTVNAQKNLAKKSKSHLNKTIRSEIGH
jgi:hypothetical protein